jgi:hypothetical protein
MIKVHPVVKALSVRVRWHLSDYCTLAEVAQLLVSVIDILNVELRKVEEGSRGIRSGPWLVES